MMLRYLSNLPYLAFFAAWLTTFTLASVFHSSMVLAGLGQLDISMELSTRLHFIWHDWLGLVKTYGVIILLGMCLSLGLTQPTKKGIELLGLKTSNSPSTLLKWYAVAGGTMMFVILQAMYPILEITVIAGARGLLGSALQILAGIIGGVIFTICKYRSAR